METTNSIHNMIHGFVKPGFEPVREEFIRNFTRRGEVGAACAAYYKGEKVVDLWGGYRDLKTHAPWEEDTLVLGFSSTKGLAAMALAVAHSYGLLDYDEKVAVYWPEFAQNGAYAPNLLILGQGQDPRETALRKALYKCLRPD